MKEIQAYIRPQMLDAVVDAVEGRAGHSGDGKIFVSAVDRAIRIRTGEKGESAVMPYEHVSEGQEEG